MILEFDKQPLREIAEEPNVILLLFKLINKE